eukprot:5059555-Pyramimonas_sp.AAC.1
MDCAMSVDGSAKMFAHGVRDKCAAYRPISCRHRTFPTDDGTSTAVSAQVLDNYYRPNPRRSSDP